MRIRITNWQIKRIGEGDCILRTHHHNVLQVFMETDSEGDRWLRVVDVLEEEAGIGQEAPRTPQDASESEGSPDPGLRAVRTLLEHSSDSIWAGLRYNLKRDGGMDKDLAQAILNSTRYAMEIMVEDLDED